MYKGNNTIAVIKEHYEDIYPELSTTFVAKLEKFSDLGGLQERNPGFKNKVIYKLDKREDYIMAAIDYLSSMTDYFAIKIFNELTTF